MGKVSGASGVSQRTAEDIGRIREALEMLVVLQAAHAAQDWDKACKNLERMHGNLETLKLPDTQKNCVRRALTLISGFLFDEISDT